LSLAVNHQVTALAKIGTAVSDGINLMKKPKTSAPANIKVTIGLTAAHVNLFIKSSREIILYHSGLKFTTT
jgi:hypothetical protein